MFGCVLLVVVGIFVWVVFVVFVSGFVDVFMVSGVLVMVVVVVVYKLLM